MTGVQRKVAFIPDGIFPTIDLAYLGAKMLGHIRDVLNEDVSFTAF